MKFYEKMQSLRKEKNYSQEDMADLLNVSRQAVAKWESGQTYPDIDNLVKLSEIFKVTIDSMIKENDDCSKNLLVKKNGGIDSVKEFLCEAKKKTYAGKGGEQSNSSRPKSHDFIFSDPKYTYMDTYLGGERFSGEEAVWTDGVPIWAMNYSGRVLDENFSGDFLKEALLLVSPREPYRGPSIYLSGNYIYHCSVDGDFNWFQGKEDIFYGPDKVYECCFHGGNIK